MTSQRMIDGIVPDRMEVPSTTDELADLIGEANLTGDWVLPLGGGTSLAAANPVDAVPIALDVTGIAGILDYEPADLTVSVGAGTRWQALQDALKHEGQTLPLDVPFRQEATVGGVVATGYAGPRRLRDGSLKDLLLGASFVRGDGLAAKAGGMVVKNVSGFEIPRLLHGSWGSLAVITSVNLKVIPLHDYDLTLISDDLDMIDAAERVLALTRKRSAIAAAVMDGSLDRVTVALRLTGRERPTRELAGEIRDEGGIPWSRTIDVPDDSAGYWQKREDRLAANGPKRVAIEIGCQPADIVDVLRTMKTAMPEAVSLHLHASPGVGSVAVSFPAGAITLDTWRRIWAEHGLARTSRFVVHSAPREWRIGSDIWSIPAGPRKLMESLKTVFDPKDTLNRGRLWTSATHVNT